MREIPAQSGANRRYADATTDELDRAIRQIHALESAVRAESLALIAEYDRRKAWKDDGSTSMSAWLVASGDGYRTAQEKARVAKTLNELPTLAGVFAEGRLTWDQYRAATRLAAAEIDAELTKTDTDAARTETENDPRPRRTHHA